MDNGEIVTIEKEPLVLMLTIPNGYTHNRLEAAEAFSKILAEAYRRSPAGTKFQFIPFSYGTNQILDAVLAIAG